MIINYDKLNKIFGHYYIQWIINKIFKKEL